MVRPPWSRRRTEEETKDFFVVREGVPDGLLMSLVEFVTPFFYIHDRSWGEVYPNTEAINHFARITDRYLPTKPDEAARQFETDRKLLLDAVDFALGELRSSGYEADSQVAELNDHLAEARSAYVVGRDGYGRYELQNRQPEEVTDLIIAATSGSDRAGEHLRRAWTKAFARKPDATGSCVEAVAAVEVAAKPLVSPNNFRATLGTIIRDMRSNPSKWTTDVDADSDLETVIAMMEMVWTGHFRHGDETKPIDVTSDGASMIVQTAALLVHWFRSGRVRIQ